MIYKHALLTTLWFFALVVTTVPKAMAADLDWSQLPLFSQRDAHAEPTGQNGNGYFNWNECWAPKFDNQPIGKLDGVLDRICQPDTLYSWGPVLKLQMLNRLAPAKGAWAKFFDHQIFSHISPLATFAYGPIQFRFKLKPGTKFHYDQSDTLGAKDNLLCKSISLAEQEHSVYVRVWHHGSLTGVDYVICSPQVIESWSYDTKTAYDETIAALNWNDDQAQGSNNLNNWVPYIYKDGNAVLFDTGIDNVDWSRETLFNRLLRMKNEAAAGHGHIIWAPGVPHNVPEVFSTKRPIYWNTH